MSRTIRRYDLDGRDLTDMPELWSETDCEILQTPYGDPEQTVGEWNVLPQVIFIRLPDCGDYRSEWIECKTTKASDVLKKWHSEGFEGFWVEA